MGGKPDVEASWCTINLDMTLSNTNWFARFERKPCTVRSVEIAFCVCRVCCCSCVLFVWVCVLCVCVMCVHVLVSLLVCAFARLRFRSDPITHSLPLPPSLIGCSKIWCEITELICKIAALFLSFFQLSFHSLGSILNATKHPFFRQYPKSNQTTHFSLSLSFPPYPSMHLLSGTWCRRRLKRMRCSRWCATCRVTNASPSVPAR